MSDQYLVLRPMAGPLPKGFLPKALPPELLRGLGYTLAVDYWPPDRPSSAMTDHHSPRMRELANKPQVIVYSYCGRFFTPSYGTE